MDSVVPGGEASPLILTEGTDTAVCDYDGVFQNILDVPGLTVNRIDDEIHAEIFRSLEDEAVTHYRIMTAQAVAGRLGFKSYARFFGDLYEDSNTVVMLFTDDPSKGLIWALTEEMSVGDWLN